MLSGGEVEHNIGGHLRLFRHWYTDPQSMFNGRHTFDAMSVAQNAQVFASEYAVFDWGIKTIPRGNIQVPMHVHAISSMQMLISGVAT